MSERMLFQIFISRMIESSEEQRPWQNCTRDEKYTVTKRERRAV